MKRVRSLIPQLISANFGIMCFSYIYFLLPLYLEHVGISAPQTVGWILGAYYAASTLPRPFMAFIVEKLPFRSTLSAAVLLCLAGSAGLALSGSSVIFMWLCRLVMGFSFGLFLVAVTTYQTMVVPDEVRGGTFALVTVGAMAPFLVVVPTADWFLQRGHFEAYIWMGPVVALGCLALALTFRPVGDSRPSGGETWGTWKELFALGPVRTLFVSAVLYGLTDAAVISISTLAMDRGLISSFFMSAFAAGAVLVRLAGFRLMDSLPRFVMAAWIFAFTSVALMLTAWATTNAMFAVCGFLYGLGIGVGFPLYLSLIGDVAPPRLRPKATAMLWFILDGCFFVTPVIMGYASTAFGVAGAFRIVPGVIFFTALPAWLFLWKPLVRSSKKNPS